MQADCYAVGACFSWTTFQPPGSVAGEFFREFSNAKVSSAVAAHGRFTVGDNLSDRRRAGKGAGPVNVAKLKPGDKLEVLILDEWQSAEFVEKISPTMVRVKRKDVPFPTPQAVDRVRLPKAAAKKTGKANSTLAGETENPFATDEEKAASAKPRSWSDRAGKFKVTATLVRVDGDRVVLRREDGKEIKVAIEALSDEDQKLVKNGNADVKTRVKMTKSYYR